MSEGQRFITNNQKTLEIRQSVTDNLNQVGMDTKNKEVQKTINSYIVLTDTQTNKDMGIHQYSNDANSPLQVGGGTSLEEAKKFISNLAQDREAVISLRFKEDLYEASPTGGVKKINR